MSRKERNSFLRMASASFGSNQRLPKTCCVREGSCTNMARSSRAKLYTKRPQSTPLRCWGTWGALHWRQSTLKSSPAPAPAVVHDRMKCLTVLNTVCGSWAPPPPGTARSRKHEGNVSRFQGRLGGLKESQVASSGAPTLERVEVENRGRCIAVLLRKADHGEGPVLGPEYRDEEESLRATFSHHPFLRVCVVEKKLSLSFPHAPS